MNLPQSENLFHAHSSFLAKIVCVKQILNVALSTVQWMLTHVCLSLNRQPHNGLLMILEVEAQRENRASATRIGSQMFLMKFTFNLQFWRWKWTGFTVTTRECLTSSRIDSTKYATATRIISLSIGFRFWDVTEIHVEEFEHSKWKVRKYAKYNFYLN